MQGIANIDKAMVRNEFKLWIYSNYLLPSKRFMLTIHVLTETHLKLLNTLTDKAIKRWAGLPPSATNALLHMQEGLGVKSISELYREVHTVSHTRTRLKGDAVVNSAINASIRRESDYTRKKSTCVAAENTFLKALESHTVMDEVPNFTGEGAATLRHNLNAKVSASVKNALSVERRTKWEDHVKTLAKYTLPTAANLKRWKKSSCDLCKLCKQRQTTDHILSACKVALNTNRYTWRHNCVISYIVNSVDSKFTVFSDLPGHTAKGGGSIPPEFCVTAEKPDIVIIDNQKKTIHLLELTCPLKSQLIQDTRKKVTITHISPPTSHYKLVK